MREQGMQNAGRDSGRPLYRSQYVSLAAAAALIADRLQAAGWLKQVPDQFVARRHLDGLEKEKDRYERRVTDYQKTLERSPTYWPAEVALKLARDHLDHLEKKLGSLRVGLKDHALERTGYRWGALSEARQELQQALHEAELVATGDLVRGRPDWKPRFRGDTQEPLSAPERRDLAACLWWFEHVEWPASAVWRESGTEVELYRGVKVRIADIDRLWPPSKEAELEAPKQTPDPPLSESEPFALRPASEAKIHEAITAAYDEAENGQRKPPNVKELPRLVQPLLRREGFRASGRRIQELAGSDEHQRRRRTPGKTVASERNR